ncbi:hypothetical protein K443DRAFT_7013 [Laccaria amethystina LaAM-08-1]|uniref:Uncharacterized protein n=1 Tax=Laccaria amethystina LaAM-08-1 TaxID=1095629 RepID=A0A0C9XZN3_9AGAR|nr:hypothetical protein K443DRAFT_7013 [Laccaria amethystina LaAM-08-1]
MRSTFFYALLISSLCPRVTPHPSNRTIDDQFGDSVTGLKPDFWSSPYIGPWDTQSLGCKQIVAGGFTVEDCPLALDATQAFMGTYSSTTRYAYQGPLGISMQFTGTAIYVFFTLVDDTNLINPTSANFLVDDELLGTFTQPNETDVRYKALVFYQTGLPNTLHKLNISNIYNVSTYLNFDYAIYTVIIDDISVAIDDVNLAIGDVSVTIDDFSVTIDDVGVID